jgi:hypothetical protein
MVQRARLILMLAEGNTYAEVEQALGCSSPYITRWKRRFLKDRMRGLSSRYVGGRARVRTPALEAKILEKTRSRRALDNLSAHKSTAVRESPEGHPQIHFHFTPTHSSWLNQVEIWFAKIERDVVARGVFTSVADRPQTHAVHPAP